jgi:hypothetical protein
MPARRITIPLGVAAALSGLVAVAVAATPSSAPAGSPAHVYRGPVATASGGSVAVVTYPSLVDVRLDRTQAALDRASTLVDRGKAPAAVPEVTAARTQMAAAWEAAKWIIKTTPPPPPPADDRAGASGGTPAGGTYAAPPDTAMAVLTLQHDVIVTSLGLVGTNATLDNNLVATIRAAAAARDAAIAYIHEVAPPPPPPDDRAGASGGAIVSSFDTTMPGVLPVLDDEIQALKGTRALIKGLPANVTKTIKAIIRRDKKTQTTINTYWPPVVGED